MEAGVSLAGTQLLPGTVAATEELAFQRGDYFELKTPPDVLPSNALGDRVPPWRNLSGVILNLYEGVIDRVPRRLGANLIH